MVGRRTTRAGEILNGIAAQAGEKTMSFKVTLAGTPEVITFAGLGLPNMKDSDYRISVNSEGNGEIDESTITPEGFSIIAGGSADVCHVFIHGNVDEL